MENGDTFELNGVRYEVVEDDPKISIRENCLNCDYGNDYNPYCGTLCCVMGLYGYHFKKI